MSPADLKFSQCRTSRLPVIYVFGKDAIDVDDCVAKLGEALRSSESTPSRILLKSDVRYAYVAGKLIFVDPIHPLKADSDSIAERLRNSFATSTITYTSPPLFSQPAATQSGFKNTVEEEESYETILYVGCESLGLTNLLMTNSSSNVRMFPRKPFSMYLPPLLLIDSCTRMTPKAGRQNQSPHELTAC